MSTYRLDASPCAVAGWVDQTSPACAAAVVAGAINAIVPSKDNAKPSSRRFSQEDVLEVSPEITLYPPARRKPIHSAKC